MSTSSDTLQLTAYHIPAVKSGGYSVEASVSVGLPGGISETFSSRKLTLEVSGPRFMLAPDEVYGVFPPADSLGEHENVLPHIELGRSTLPWERASGSAEPRIPWLGLILLQQEELEEGSKVKAERIEWPRLRDILGLKSEAADDPDEGKEPFQPVKVLRIHKDLIGTIVPDAESLKWLSHVRIARDPQGNELERAVLVCNRMAKPGSSAEVHLVSLEDRFDSQGFVVTRGDPEGSGMVPFLSLYSWRFSCPEVDEYKLSDRNIARVGDRDAELASALRALDLQDKEALFRGREGFLAFLEEKGVIARASQPTEAEKRKRRIIVEACRLETETFKGLMDSLNLGVMKVSGGEPGAPFFEAGSIPVAHLMRNGDHTVSWYRGPLIPSGQLGQGLEMKLPVRSSDALLMFNEDTGMLDISYAAAWELGRWLSVSQPRISQQIAQWKASHAREAAEAEQRLVFDHIPFADADLLHGEESLLTRSLQGYFSDLRLLRGLPFHYLVPNERLLPMESLRLFHVDPFWMEALLDGAFSVGRVTALDRRREQGALSLPHHGQPRSVTGILLRSDLVAGWPSLQVDGYGHGGTESDPPKLPVLRFERLGRSVLIVLFDGILKSLDIYLPAQALHFGFIRPVHEGEDYFKELRSLTDGSELLEGDGSLLRKIEWRSRELRVFDPGAFVGGLPTTKLGATEELHSGHLAAELLEGVPRLRVVMP